MTEEQKKLENLLLAGKFDLAIAFVKQSTFSNKEYIINEINILRTTPEATKLVNSTVIESNYLNLITTTTDIEETESGFILKDKNNNKLGIAINGNEKYLLDYYSSQVYNKLSTPALNKKEQLSILLSLIKEYSIKKNGINYICNINGHFVSFYPIGNNNEIHGYALILDSKNKQKQNIIIDNAKGLSIFLKGLKETFF